MFKARLAFSVSSSGSRPDSLEMGEETAMESGLLTLEDMNKERSRVTVTVFLVMNLMMISFMIMMMIIWLNGCLFYC